MARSCISSGVNGGALLGVSFHVATIGADEVAGPGRKSRERDPVFLVRLLDAGGLEVVEDHLREGLPGCVIRAVFAHGVDQLVVFIDAEHAAWVEAFDGEGNSARRRVSMVF